MRGRKGCDDANDDDIDVDVVDDDSYYDERWW